MRMLAGATLIIALYIPAYFLVLLPLGSAIGCWNWVRGGLTSQR